MKVKVNENFDGMTIDIIAYDNIGAERNIYNFRKREFEIVSEGVNELKEDWVIRIPNIIADEMLIEIMKALNKKGIKTEEENKLEGKLEATEYHLEDLRQLLKLKNVVINKKL